MAPPTNATQPGAPELTLVHCQAIGHIPAHFTKPTCQVQVLVLVRGCQVKV